MFLLPISLHRLPVWFMMIYDDWTVCTDRMLFLFFYQFTSSGKGQSINISSFLTRNSYAFSAKPFLSCFFFSSFFFSGVFANGNGHSRRYWTISIPNNSSGRSLPCQAGRPLNSTEGNLWQYYAYDLQSFQWTGCLDYASPAGFLHQFIAQEPNHWKSPFFFFFFGNCRGSSFRALAIPWES